MQKIKATLEAEHDSDFLDHQVVHFAEEKPCLLENLSVDSHEMNFIL